MDPKNYFAEDPANLEFGKIEGEQGSANQQANNNVPGNENEDDGIIDARKPNKNHDQRRWERLMKERDQDRETISELAKFKSQVEQGKFSNFESGVPDHFKKMYEDGLTIEERWQAQRDFYANQQEQMKAQTRTEILEEITKTQREQEQWEDYIDQNLESLEEEYDIDLTSGSVRAERLKKDFLTTVAKLSPKDSEGNILSYAPFDSSFELWSKNKNLKTKPSDNADVDRKKDLSSLGNSRPAAANTDYESGEGGMWGWKKDLGQQQ